MEIKQVPAHISNYSVGRMEVKVDRIVVHWMVGSLESADASFANSDRNASAHYGIGDDEVHQYVGEENTAWHSGNWEMNLRSIGIEHEGGQLLPDGTTRLKPSPRTHQTSSKLIADLCMRYHIPVDRKHVLKHNEIKATQCPGTLDLDKILKMANVIINAEEMIINDQTKIPVGGEWGDLEVQAIRSILNDQKIAIQGIPGIKKDLGALAKEVGDLQKGLRALGAEGKTIEELVSSLKEKMSQKEPVFSNPLAKLLYVIAKSLK